MQTRRAMQTSLSLDELKSKFKKHTVTAALQCTGNRRTELNAGEADACAHL
jgi:hypothetical protein